jgi:hypothetical protein
MRLVRVELETSLNINQYSNAGVQLAPEISFILTIYQKMNTVLMQLRSK